MVFFIVKVERPDPTKTLLFVLLNVQFSISRLDEELHHIPSSPASKKSQLVKVKFDVVGILTILPIEPLKTRLSKLTLVFVPPSRIVVTVEICVAGGVPGQYTVSFFVDGL